MSIGQPVFREQSPDPSGNSTIAANQATIGRYRLGQGTIFITNSVPYIVFLEEGSSDQAPRGMTRFAIQAANNVLRRARLLQGL